MEVEEIILSQKVERCVIAVLVDFKNEVYNITIWLIY